MSEIIREGTPVIWKWGNGHGEGNVIEIFHERVTRNIKGSTITRNGSEDNPAYLIEQDDGDLVLKLHSEVTIGHEEQN